MFERNKAFLGETGITSTSANFLANLAKEQTAKYQGELDELNFLEVNLTIIGGGAPQVAKEGKDEVFVASIMEKASFIASMNSYCAWVRQAIEAKDAEKRYWENYPIESWAKEIEHIQLPDINYGIRVPLEQDIIDEMNVKDRAEYVKLSAIAATFGKLIHESGPFNKARKALHKGLANPAWTSGDGRDTIIYSNHASCNPEIVDSTFNGMQDYHRSIEQRLNKIRGHIKEELDKRILEYNQKQSEYLAQYKLEMSELRVKFNTFITNKLAEVAALKIIIPDSLKETHDLLNNLGK